MDHRPIRIHIIYKPFHPLSFIVVNPNHTVTYGGLKKLRKAVACIGLYLPGKIRSNTESPDIASELEQPFIFNGPLSAEYNYRIKPCFLGRSFPRFIYGLEIQSCI